jgi:hypothetical protein
MLELAYRIACDGDGCSNCTQFSESKALVEREAREFGIVRTTVRIPDGDRGLGYRTERPHLCRECRERAARVQS